MKPIKRYLFFTFLENLCLDFLPLKGTHLDLSIENFVFWEDVFSQKKFSFDAQKGPFLVNEKRSLFVNRGIIFMDFFFKKVPFFKTKEPCIPKTEPLYLEKGTE